MDLHARVARKFPSERRVDAELRKKLEKRRRYLCISSSYVNTTAINNFLFFVSSIYFSGNPATLTRLIQYRLPFPSGKLWPKCVPSTETASPSGRIRTYSQFTSLSRKLSPNKKGKDVWVRTKMIMCYQVCCFHSKEKWTLVWLTLAILKKKQRQATETTYTMRFGTMIHLGKRMDGYVTYHDDDFQLKSFPWYVL